MTTATKQLEAIYQEISQQFSGDNRITVTPIDGDPPEKYEITYQVAGVYKDDTGEVKEKHSHTITISIPFGFPHFPPSCKPKSTIFHPDFDPAAICIGDFWEKDCTISDLIIHIGEMISGRIFSKNNAFNEEAAVWYKKNSSRLPFGSEENEEVEKSVDNASLDDFDFSLPTDDEVATLFGETEHKSSFEDLAEALDSATAKETDAADLDDLFSGTFETESDLGVDTLDDSFLETDFDYLSTKNVAPETKKSAPPRLERDDDEGSNAIDVEKLKLLNKQKRFFELDSRLGLLTPDQTFAQRDTLAQRAGTALQKARDLYNRGTNLEHKGHPERALEAFNQVQTIVSDYPGIQEDIQRTTEANELLGDWEEPAPPVLESGSNKKSGGKKSAGTGDKKKKPPAKKKLSPPVDQPFAPPKNRPAKQSFFEDQPRHTSKILPYTIAAALLILGTAAAFFYYSNASRLGKARSIYAECEMALTQNRFAEAERQCDTARDLAKRVLFLKSGARDSLIATIDKTLDSQVLKEGLAGRISFEGKFLAEQTVKNLRAFNSFKSEGDTHFAAENWAKAIEAYDQSLQVAGRTEGIEQEMIAQLTENLTSARFRVLYQSGIENVDQGQWVRATEDLSKALKLAPEIMIENKAEIVGAISAKLSEIALETAKEQGDVAFAEQRWADAFASYTKAVKAAEDAATRDDPTINALKRRLVNAELYNTIQISRKAFQEGQWNRAIENYGKAIAILENNREFLTDTNTEANRRKLARVILQATIIRDKQAVAADREAEEYDAAAKKLQALIAIINASEFSSDPEFTSVLKELKDTLEQTKTDKFLADKLTYLRDNFTELFTKNYIGALPESLTEQKVFFERRIGNKLLFRLECIEIGKGRPLRLVMKYTHDLNTGRWSFYSGKN